jgi:arylsulfatase A
VNPAADRPSIILVNCDDLGYGDLGCFGSTVHDTPHLDRMAREGMRFTDFYQASPLCSPSRGAMLTGCYPRRIGFDRFEGRGVLFPGQGVGLDPREVTFARILKDHGYATQMVGKWHCGDQPAFLPTRHGFDAYYGLPYSNDMGRQKGHESSPPLPLLRDEEVIELQPDQASLTERYLEEAVRFIRGNRAQPFLLYFAHLYVHLPHYVPDRFLVDSRNGRYGAAVACIDWVMGVLLHELRTRGIAERTLVLFTSDNGSRCDYGRSNGDLRGGKGTTWEGGMRLPLIAWRPGSVPAGSVCREVASGMDFLPTFARLAGAEPPTHRCIDGADIGPLLRGTPGAGSPREALYYYSGSSLDAVRAGRWKLFVGRRGRGSDTGETGLHELYDLEEDPGETRDVADAHPGVVRELEDRVAACRADLGDAAVGIAGTGCRPIGRVADPRPLATFDPSHPYFTAMYDLDEAG